MSTTYNIQMQKYNGTDYDILYPKSNLENVTGVLSIENGGTGANNTNDARQNLEAAGWVEVEPLINQWNEEWKLGKWDTNTGKYVLTNNTICSADYIPIKPGKYYVHTISTLNLVLYDSNFSKIAASPIPNSQGRNTFTAPSNTAYMTFTMSSNYGTTYNYDVSVNYPLSYTGYYPAGLSKVEADRINNDTMLAMDGYISPVIGGIGNYKSGNEYHKRIGRVDLGTLDWAQNVSKTFFVTTDVPSDAKKPDPDLHEIMHITSKYIATSAIASYNDMANKPDKSSCYYSTTNYFYFFIIDSSYTDAATFKAAMPGVYLYYELATEEVRNIDGTEIGDSLGKLGNAIVRGGWNQLVNFPDYSATITSGITHSKVNGVFHLSGTATQIETTFLSNAFTVSSGHKYLVYTNRHGTFAGNDTWQIYVTGVKTYYNIGKSYSFTASDSGVEHIHVAVYREPIDVDFVLQVFDLTEIFGVGNEPTVEQFKQLFPDDYYPYATSPIGKLGNAIVRSGWNQLARINPGTYTDNGITFVANADGSINVTGTATAHDAYIQLSELHDIGHKILLSGGDIRGIHITFSGTPNVSTPIPIIITTAAVGNIYLRVPIGVTLSGVTIFPQVFDLTEIFGAGNEPSSVEQFKQLFPDNYYPYATPEFGDLLWKNASPSSAFAPQTLGVSFDYSKYAVIFRMPNDSVAPLFIIEKACSGLALGLNNNQINMRNVTVSNNGALVFGNGYYINPYGTGTLDDTRMVPLRIYGIR